MHADVSGGVVRFVESRFEEQKTAAEIERMFGPVRDVVFRTLTLRQIFLAVAKREQSA